MSSPTRSPSCWEFGIVFTLLGVTFYVAAGPIRDLTIVRQIGGVILIILGLNLMGVIRIGLLEPDIPAGTNPVRSSPAGWGRCAQSLGAFALGTIFAIGWTPCIGPTLGAILTLSALSVSPAVVVLLIAYSLGLGIPFVALALAMDGSARLAQPFLRHGHAIELIGGGLVVVIGLAILFDSAVDLRPRVRGLLAAGLMTGRANKPLVGPFTAFQVLAVLVAVVVTALVLMFVNTPLANPATPGLPTPGTGFVPVGDPVEGLRVGDLAPPLSGTVGGAVEQLTDLNAQPINLADYRGRPVWISFFATWCPPCQEETPVLRDTFAAHQADGLALIAVSVQETTADDVRAYVQRYSLGYTVGFDATSAVFHAYQAYGLPTQFFLDKSGVIRNVVLGPVTRDQVETILAPLLAG